MKEQVSVAYVGNTAFLDKDEYVRLKQSEEKLNKLYSVCKFNEKTLEDLLAHAEKLEAENTRLKRLDENRKRIIAEYKKCINGKFGDDYASRIHLLESLDK